MDKNPRILVIQTAFIGDVVLTTPMLKSIKDFFPYSKLSVMVKPEAEKILKALKFIDEIMILDKKGKHKFLGMFSFINLIRKKKFDVVLSPHQSLRTSLIVLFLKCPLKVGYKNSALSSIVYDKRLDRTNKHEIHRLLDFLRDSLIPELKDYPDAPILEETEDSKKKAKNLIETFPSKPIAIAPSSIWPTKRWTSWGFAELSGRLIEKYKSDIILIGSSSDYDIAEHVLQIAKTILPAVLYKKIHNFCGKTDLLTLYSLLKLCRLLVSNDSAPVHFGCAAHIPVVAIFGPTTKELGYAPICNNSRIVEIENLYCRPCGTHGGKKCPEKHFRCMKEITGEMVYNKILELNI